MHYSTIQEVKDKANQELTDSSIDLLFAYAFLKPFRNKLILDHQGLRDVFPELEGKTSEEINNILIPTRTTKSWDKPKGFKEDYKWDKKSTTFMNNLGQEYTNSKGRWNYTKIALSIGNELKLLIPRLALIKFRKPKLTNKLSKLESILDQLTKEESLELRNRINILYPE